MGAPNSSRARSRLSIAMLTPAQKPRGLARMIFTSASLGCGYPTAATAPLPTAPGAGDGALEGLFLVVRPGLDGGDEGDEGQPQHEQLRVTHRESLLMKKMA